MSPSSVSSCQSLARAEGSTLGVQVETLDPLGRHFGVDSCGERCDPMNCRRCGGDKDCENAYNRTQDVNECGKNTEGAKTDEMDTADNDTCRCGSCRCAGICV